MNNNEQQEESKNEQSLDSPLGYSTLDRELFKTKILSTLDNIPLIIERNQ
jgi:hypothetical protein